jgi:catalase-peroxidase
VPVIEALRSVQEKFNGSATGGKKVSLADLIVLGGCAALEKAAANAGVPTEVPFAPGRRDTTQELTDIEMFTWLKPVADGFRNYLGKGFSEVAKDVAPEQLFLDKAQLLHLTAPEWVALTGGLRAMNANHDNSPYGIFTDRVGVLTNDFFTVLTSTDYEWQKADATGLTFSLEPRVAGKKSYVATRADLVFGSNSQLRTVAEVYAGSDGHPRFVKAFVKAWDKVMMLDRYDVKK